MAGMPPRLKANPGRLAVRINLARMRRRWSTLANAHATQSTADGKRSWLVDPSLVAS